MDEASIVNLCRPHFDRWIELTQRAFDRFDEIHSPEPALRIPVEGSRADYVSEYLLHLVEQEYGRDQNAPARIVDDSHMRYLLLESDSFCAGIRFKKLRRGHLSSNHVSENQTRVRRWQFAQLYENNQTAFVFLGWQCSTGLQPRLTDISLTSEVADRFEHYALEWRHVVWHEGEGREPIAPFNPPLYPEPTGPRILPRLPGTQRESGDQQG